MSSVEDLDLLFEGSYFVGIVLCAILYGVYLGIYYLSLCAIIQNINLTYPQRIFYISYGTALLLLNTLFFPTLLLLGQMMWITDRTMYPGGPLQYYFSQFTNANYMIMGNVAQNLAIFLADALLIFRCYIIFGSRLSIIVIPAFCSIASLGLLMATVPLGLGHGVPTTVEDGVDAAGIILSAVTNVVVTVMISTKLLSVYFRMRKYVEHEAIKPYANAIVILVELAAASSGLGVLASVLMLRQSIKWYLAVFLVWSAAVAISPQLIIFRIATGVAWTNTDSSSLELSSFADSMA